MKVVILAGGRGSRLSEETTLKPKPMVEIGSMPMLWHIMKIYSSYGYNDFIICCGYKGELIKEYFLNYYMRTSNITVDLSKNSVVVHEKVAEPWKVTLVDTGLNTNTAGRVMKIKDYIQGKEFMLTYGDGVSDVNINELVEFHYASKKIATITASKPAGRWGTVKVCEEDGSVLSFREKNQNDQTWVNSGFAVFKKEFFEYLEDESHQLEKEPYEKLVDNNQMSAYLHRGFWHPMDTVNDRNVLQEYWASGKAPWKVW